MVHDSRYHGRPHPARREAMGVFARRPAGSTRRGTTASTLGPRAPSWGEVLGLVVVDRLG